MEKLQELPNISDVVAGKLEAAGIDSPEELRRIGSKEAFARIRRDVDPGACLSMLCALEGAVQGIRWHGLDNAKKAELREFCEAL